MSGEKPSASSTRHYYQFFTEKMSPGCKESRAARSLASRSYVGFGRACCHSLAEYKPGKPRGRYGVFTPSLSGRESGKIMDGKNDEPEKSR
jgi:hypothetical protein